MESTLSMLISDYFDQTLSGEDSVRLAEQLRSDRQSRREFVGAAIMHRQLEETFATLRSLRGSVKGSSLYLPPFEDSFESLLRDAMRSASNDLLQGEPVRTASHASRLRSLGSPVFTLLHGVASQRIVSRVFIVLLISAGLLLSNRWWRDSAARHSSDSTSTMVASLTIGEHCRWDQGDLAPGEIFARGPLRLLSGIAKLKFARGAQIVVEGPCDFELRSADNLYLSRGRLLAQVPPQAIGFTVETKMSKVIDRGTEFAIEVIDNAQTRLAVTKGSVDLLAGANSPQRVDAGNAMAVARNDAGEATIKKVSFDAAWTHQVVALDRVVTMSANAHVAYQAHPNRTPGNTEAFHGAIGLDFDLEQPIRVLSLGVFDSLGDGIAEDSPLVVQLWSRDHSETPHDLADDTGTSLLAEIAFSRNEPGTYEYGHRFKPLMKAIELPPGSYSIVAYGGSHEDSFIDLASGKGAISYVATADGKLQPSGSRSQKGCLPDKFPSAVTVGRVAYVAGSFKYEVVDEARRPAQKGQEIR